MNPTRKGVKLKPKRIWALIDSRSGSVDWVGLEKPSPQDKTGHVWYEEQDYSTLGFHKPHRIVRVELRELPKSRKK